MKYIIIAIMITFALQGYAQTDIIDNYLNKIPEKQETSLSSPLCYQLTIDMTGRDIDGKVLWHRIADGKLKQILPDDTTEFQDVTLTEIVENTKTTNPLTELNGLKYKIEGDNFTKLDFYKDFPPAHVDLIRTFIQDQVGFNVYGQMYLDSLKFNVPLYPDFFQNQQADFEQDVNFNTKALNITWTGISKKNGKTCALIHYQAMYNPFSVDNDIRITDGRSCFWGDIWIALDTRQIEYATMSEDVISKTKFKANNYEVRVNVQREIKLEKIKK
jgi:hypothetical protein